MFIKWLTDLFRVWRKSLEAAFVFWIVVTFSWLVVLTHLGMLLISSAYGESREPFVIFLKIIVPIAVVIGVIPSLLLAAWKIGGYIRRLYADWRHYAKSGEHQQGFYK